jgi:AcrR family transcriptional regulator
MSGRPAALTNEQIEAARAARAEGARTADIAEALGVSERTLYRALGDAYSGAPSPAVAPPGRDALDVAREAFERVDAVAQRELAAGNVAAYTDLIRQQALLLNSIRQLEQARSSESADSVTFMREELEAGAALVTERLAALEADARANGGLTCVRCGEALRRADALDVGEREAVH